MHLRHEGGFSLVEGVLATALLALIIGGLAWSSSGARREEELTSLELSIMESAAISVQQLQLDLRQMVILSHKPVIPFSVRIAPDGKAIRLRRNALPHPGDPAARPFVYVQYDLVPATLAGRYFLRRQERTHPAGRREARPEKVYRTFTLKDAGFVHLSDAGGTLQALHVNLELISENAPRSSRSPFSDRTLPLTNLLLIEQPEAPWTPQRPFAETVPLPEAEQPVVDVVTTATGPAEVIPPFEEAP